MRLHDDEPGTVEGVLEGLPLPPRSIDLRFMLDTTCGTRFADQATAACTSTYVGWAAQSSTTGWPTVHSATVP